MSDTIAAIATPAGAGGVGVLRVSGPAVPDMARQLLGRSPRPRHAHYLRLRDADGGTLDFGLMLYFPAPRSFTGEHVLEIHAHGSPVILHGILRRLMQLGARAAHAGEFSQRAFLNDKIDLTQAEAIADLISAGSELAARAALRSLEGEFSRRVDSLFERLVEVRLHVEAAIDFPEEEIDFLADGQISARLERVRGQLAELLQEARRGQRLRDGLHVVIVGAPNAGKSSLLNALTGQDRAIVADQPGTTRDLLRENISLDGVELMLVDTAGLRTGGDAVEREGMRRAQQELVRADLALAVLAPGDSPDALSDALHDVSQVIWLHSKSDLIDADAPLPAIAGSRAAGIPLSTRTGAGLDTLRAALKEAAGRGDGADGAFSARARHVEALHSVETHLTNAAQQLLRRQGELVAEELLLAQRALGEITGQFHSDDLLGRIFGSFCIGK